MGRFRSLLHRFVKPAAMVGTVGVLSLGLVVTTPSTAQAIVTYDKIKPAATFITGATKTIGPAAIAVATSVTPVGWGLKLAFLAFSTADLWLPLVTGAFGSPPTNEPADATAYRIKPGLKGMGVNPRGAMYPGWITFQWQYVGGGTAQGIMFVHKGVCRSDSLSSGQPVGAIFNASTNSTASAGSGDSGNTYSVNAKVCPDGSTIQSATVGPPVTGSQYPGPENVVSFGGTGFDPRGANVGYKGRSECIDAQGTISWVEGPTTPGDNDGGTMVMPSCEKAGKGHGTGRTQVIGFKPDGGQETIWDTGTAGPLSDPATPLCDPGRAGSGCVMEVLKDDKPCTSGDVECENWSEESKKDSTRWKCKFGPYTLPIASCNLLERAYVPGGSALNEPNTDGNPDTRSPAGPDGNPVAPPAPTVTSTVPGSPTPGAPGAPGPGADQQTRQCWPTGWGMFNPFEWVLKPIRCAMEPTKNFAAEGGALRDKAMTKAPLSFVTAISATAPASVGGQGACPAWVVHISATAGGMNGNYSKNVVCESSFIQSIVNARPVLFGLISGAMLWPFLRSLWYAMIPVVRVIPTGGK